MADKQKLLIQESLTRLDFWKRLTGYWECCSFARIVSLSFLKDLGSFWEFMFGFLYVYGMVPEDSFWEEDKVSPRYPISH